VDDAGLDECPWAMANHADRLAAVNKAADKADGRLVLPPTMTPSGRWVVTASGQLRYRLAGKRGSG
jgi:hypothetical protein